MTQAHPTSPTSAYAPPRQHLVALALLSLWVVVLSLPMWNGEFVAGPGSDQYASGYAVREWAAAQWRAAGHMPLWNPFIFGGVPIAAGFGDVFYPTAWLRLVMPTAIAMDLAFVVHYVLAAYFLYILLRLLGVSWTGGVVGGTAYQLSGVVVSYVSPGHDGKLYVTALLPLMLIGLVLAIRRRRLEGYAILGLATGLALLSPQYQMAQYALVTAGLFTLYLAFGEPEGLAPRQRWTAIAAAAGAVALGFAVAMIQLLPFVQYIPWSPRAEAAGFAWSTSYDVPWIHVPEFFLAGFSGSRETYWGPNPLKLHSEYLGLSVVALAALGIGSGRRRLVLWTGGIGLLLLLVALGDATPFYRLWWTVVPYVKKTRAPGMALYVVSLALAILAALGVERLQQGGAGRRAGPVLLAAGLMLALLAGTGVFGEMASAWARAHPSPYGDPNAAIADTARGEILEGALGSAAALAVLGGIVVAHLRRRLPAPLFAPLVILLVGADLWRAGAGFWRWSRPEQTIYAPDAIIDRIRQSSAPFRVLDGGVYPLNVLMRHRISQVLGYHGNQPRTYDELLGREGDRWRHVGSPQLWRLLSVHYVVLRDSAGIPGFHHVLGPVPTSPGQVAHLYMADSAPPYARVATAAIKLDEQQIIPTLLDSRLPGFDRLVFYDRSQPVDPPPIDAIPPASPVAATVSAWEPGRMTIDLGPAPVETSYLLVSENWYPDWQARVDGKPARTLRGNHSLLTVPLAAGARRVELEFRSRAYARGKGITAVAVLSLLAMLIVPAARRRRRG